MVEVSKSEHTIIQNVLYGVWFTLATLVLLVQSLIKAFIPRSYRPPKSLEGEIALITGGAGGIGRLVALKLAKLKAVVVLWDVNTKGIEESVNMVKTAGGRAYGYTCDLTNREEIYRVAAKVSEDVGQVTILVNNAGVVSGKLLLDTPDHLIQRTFDVNIIAHFWTTKAFLPKMIETNHGHIITVASMAGFIGVHKLVDYCATKFAAIGFNESLRMELDSLDVKGVKTSAICPYFIQSTGMFNDVQSRLVPKLNNNMVADRIVEAIQYEDIVVLIPSYLRLIAFKLLLPWTAVSLMLRNLVINPTPEHPEHLSNFSKLVNKTNNEEPVLNNAEVDTVTHHTTATIGEKDL